MPDTEQAFPTQSEYAFAPPAPGEQDDAADAQQRNQQIQAAFDSQRFQRSQSQGVSKAFANQSTQIANQSAQIAQLRQRQAQQKT